MDINLNVGLEGHYVIEKRSKYNSHVERYEFDNIVIDVGWGNFKDRAFQGGGATVPDYLYLGTGTAEPSVTDTGLESISGTLAAKLGYVITRTVLVDPGVDMRHQTTLKFEYGEGEAEGNWTELGLAYDNAYSAPYNRSLFRDDVGNPISLTVLSDEFLTVYVVLQVRLSLTTSVIGTLSHNGNSIGYSAFFNEAADDDDVNIWKNGLPRFGHHYNTSPTGLAYYTGVTSSQTVATLTSNHDILLDPGSERTIIGLGIGSRTEQYGSRLALVIQFDTAIVKAADERLTGSFSVTINRA